MTSPFLATAHALSCLTGASTWDHLSLRDSLTGVQPMTGIVYWTDSDRKASDAVALEFSYMSFAAVSPGDGVWNWKPVDSLLDAVASRKHQAILRFRYDYVGLHTTVPAWIQAKPAYQETVGKSEGLDTWFSDWRSDDLKRFTLDFHKAFAARYQDDKRLAFVQMGFGLWAEYHIYDGPMVLGRTFPDRAFQTNFLRHLDTVYTRLPWNISIDAANDWAPFDSVPPLKNLGFGLFDDSFMAQSHETENRPNWLYFGETRWRKHPAGGELSYYSDFDQQHALDSAGMYGRTFDSQAARYGLSYIIGNDQPQYHTDTRIRQASRACGYRFRAVAWDASVDSFRLGIANTGAAPLYRDAWPVVGADTSRTSLRGLAPGDTAWFLFPRRTMASNSDKPSLACGHCVAGQRIGLEANLPGSTGIQSLARAGASVECRWGRGSWWYRSTQVSLVRAMDVSGRTLWRGELPATGTAWKPAPFSGEGLVVRSIDPENSSGR